MVTVLKNKYVRVVILTTNGGHTHNVKCFDRETHDLVKRKTIKEKSLQYIIETFTLYGYELDYIK